MAKKNPPAPIDTTGMSFGQRLWVEWNQQRKRGLIQQQRDMAITPRQAEFFSETQRILKTVRIKSEATRRVDKFEEAVHRQGLTQEHLDSKFRQHKTAHLLMYACSCAILIYSFWLLLNVGWFIATGALLGAIAIALNGYLQGFRAWQIQHRNLISLGRALRMADTYLIL